MPSFILSLVTYASGTNHNDRSHWGFTINRIDEQIVSISDLDLLEPDHAAGLIWQSALGQDVVPRDKKPNGSWGIAALTISGMRIVTEIVEVEKAPQDSGELCQDWALRAVATLEAERFVGTGTTAYVGGLVGKSDAEVSGVMGQERRWT